MTRVDDLLRSVTTPLYLRPFVAWKKYRLNKRLVAEELEKKEKMVHVGHFLIAITNCGDPIGRAYVHFWENAYDDRTYTIAPAIHKSLRYDEKEFESGQIYNEVVLYWIEGKTSTSHFKERLEKINDNTETLFS